MIPYDVYHRDDFSFRKRHTAEGIDSLQRDGQSLSKLGMNSWSPSDSWAPVELQNEMPAMVARSISLLSVAGLGMAMINLGEYNLHQMFMKTICKSELTFVLVYRFVHGCNAENYSFAALPWLSGLLQALLLWLLAASFAVGLLRSSLAYCNHASLVNYQWKIITRKITARWWEILLQYYC